MLNTEFMCREENRDYFKNSKEHGPKWLVAKTFKVEEKCSQLEMDDVKAAMTMSNFVLSLTRLQLTEFSMVLSAFSMHMERLASANNFLKFQLRKMTS